MRQPDERERFGEAVESGVEEGAVVVGQAACASDATVDASVNGAIMSGEDAARAVRMAIGDTGTATVARFEGTGDAW